LGACVVEQPFIIISQLATIFYFFYFLIIIPFLSIIEYEAKKIDSIDHLLCQEKEVL